MKTVLQVLELVKSDREFLLYGLWVAAIACLAGALLFAGLSAIFAVVNTATTPIGAVTGVPGLYLWNSLAKFIPQGATVDKILYKEILGCLSNSIRRKRPELWHRKNWLLLHDNAPAHRSILVQEELARQQVAVLPHPPYSPDLAPCDFFRFPLMKSILRGRNFYAAEKVMTATREAVRHLPANIFQRCFQKLHQRWQTCIAPTATILRENVDLFKLFFNLCAVSLWAVQFYQKLQYNVMSREDRQNNWSSTNRAYYGYSFWFVVGAIVIHFLNIIAIYIGTHETREKKTPQPMIEEKSNGAIMLY
ncbi:hypothetical protein ANN_23957 [Periplaneta americana]|uniref:Uncharacterized protein n=1 Tax=Periplaneta americana TaxID=6978 RepID=A0ABQ8S1Z7_PERAM|nr:hypothetical protein ANN_23957 [Periplaneta americana]